jgi:hypothetical protein
MKIGMTRYHNKRIPIYLQRMMCKIFFQKLERKSMVISKYIYNIKHAADGSVEKYKVRSTAKGFSQT